jgi:hypothetical protein
MQFLPKKKIKPLAYNGFRKIAGVNIEMQQSRGVK